MNAKFAAFLLKNPAVFPYNNLMFYCQNPQVQPVLKKRVSSPDKNTVLNLNAMNSPQ
jgi:hypothetical protein